MQCRAHSTRGGRGGRGRAGAGGTRHGASTHPDDYDPSSVHRPILAAPSLRRATSPESPTPGPPHPQVDPFRKDCLLNGLDHIGLTLQKMDTVRDFEAKRSAAAPWLDGATTHVRAKMSTVSGLLLVPVRASPVSLCPVSSVRARGSFGVKLLFCIICKSTTMGSRNLLGGWR